MSPLDPAEILGEVAPDNQPLPEPPPVANYRDADIQGISCANCAKFSMTGVRVAHSDAMNADIEVPVGFCHQWEANVDGVKVCDRYASPTPPWDENGQEDFGSWDFSDNSNQIVEVHLSETEQREESGFVVKEILRTGEWPVIPTKGGTVNKPLRIIRDGMSSREEGVISLSELADNFSKTGLRVQIPLSDDDNDHKNITKLNTGYVRDIWISDENGVSKLVAKLDFTEPDVREKVLRGTYADVSCGIPWELVSRGQKYGTCLEHVAITNRPFIDGLGPFMLASDKKDFESVHFSDKPADDYVIGDSIFSAKKIMADAAADLKSSLGLSANYLVTDLTNEGVVVENDIANTSWVVPFSTNGEGISLAAVNEWKFIKDEGEQVAPAEDAVPRHEPSSDRELEAAHKLREIRFSERPIQLNKEANMPLTHEDLDRLEELTPEVRASIQKILDENIALSAQNREKDVDKRIAELEELGLKDRPGALVLYRQIALSDDQGAAALVTLSDGQKETMTATAILDRFIDAVRGPDGKVTLSDQALVSGNDEMPPATPEGERKPLEERVAEAKQALGKN